MKSIHTLAPVVLQSIFGTLAKQLGRSTGFIRRQGKLLASDLARTLSLHLIRFPQTSMQQLAIELSISASALCQRLQQQSTVQFLRQLLVAAVQKLATSVQSKTHIAILQRFRGVYLNDCTTLGLPASLVGCFRGCGGGAKSTDQTAAVKVLLQIELSGAGANQLAIAAGRTPDVTMLKTLKRLPAQALEISDLGFFDVDRFAIHNRRGVFWLSRLPARISIFHNGLWQELAAWLKQLKGIDCWDQTMSIAKVSPLSARVLLVRCPAQESARRRRKLHQRMKEKGRRAGWRQLVLCDWWVMATNLSSQKLTLAEASDLYRVRWQIELVFKRWKSLGQVRVALDLSPQRTQCELYGRLLGVLVVEWLALLRCGLLSGRSSWQAWQVVLGMLGEIVGALKGRMDWKFVLEELIEKLKRIPQQPQRMKTPSTRQRLLKS
jgi:hypothetical protein